MRAAMGLLSKLNWALVARALGKIGRMIPLVGQLASVKVEALKQALYETLSTTIFATLPLWFLPIIGPYFDENTPSISDSAREGEVFIYGAVLLGPLIYIISKRYGRFNIRRQAASEDGSEYTAGPLSFTFPYGGLFLIICAFTCFLAGYAITRVRAGRSMPESLSSHGGIETLSLLVFITATLVFFLVCAYRNMLDDKLKNAASEIVGSQPREETEFTDLWLRNKK